MLKIRIAIVGVGNCASSLVQGIHYYQGKGPEEAIGLMHWEIGGARPCDLEVVAAFEALWSPILGKGRGCEGQHQGKDQQDIE